MDTLWMEMFSQTTGDGQSFAIRGQDVFHACSLCDAHFPQTDEGWAALKKHGFDLHEAPMSFRWAELQGKTVTIGVVDRTSEDDPEEHQIELIARDEDGVVYFLPFSHYDVDEETGFKCKPKSQGSNLSRIMQRGQA